jgi:UDP-N-acetylglucosamine acyltransferase
MTATIHSSAIVEDGATIGENVRIGPFCLVGSRVTLEDNVELISHAVVTGNTRIGEATRIFPFASVGHEPQDLKYRGEENRLLIGKKCIVREGVTLNPGTAGDKSETLIGDGCVFLANSHVAHDCIVGDGSILSNNVMLAGHCDVGRNVIFGGGAGVHQFCRIGDNAFIGGLAGIGTDVIPFGIAVGNRASLAGLNVIGMKRAGMDSTAVHNVRRAYKFLFASGKPLAEALGALDEALRADPAVAKIVSFIEASGNRGLCTPGNGDFEA